MGLNDVFKRRIQKTLIITTTITIITIIILKKENNKKKGIEMNLKLIIVIHNEIKHCILRLTNNKSK
jgi:hypothetical protein